MPITEETGPVAITGRCAHCRRRLRNSVQSILHADGTATAFCGQRAACRRACDEALGGTKTDGASTEAFGAALIAADYVDWPWWGRLVPAAARDTMRSRFARAMSAAVEERASRPLVEDEG